MKIALNSVLEEFQWRELVADCTSEADVAALTTKPTAVYCGFDPTADSLHVGSLVPLMALKRFQLLGHTPIALIGGATGMIGDPSGKSKERNLLDPDTLNQNVRAVSAQITAFLGPQAKVVNNADWLKNMGFLEFLLDVGKHFSVNQMLTKDSVKSRMGEENGISYTEFSYQIVQAFDFYNLAKNHDCRLQIGGSDQWGNITAGIDLTRKKTGIQVVGLTMPLVLTAAGTKFGKTEAGTIWLDKAKTSEHDFYQFWIHTDDRDVIKYLKMFTLLPKEQIHALTQEHLKNPAGRQAHKALAENMTELVHGPQVVQKMTAGSSIFLRPANEFSSEELNALSAQVPGIRVPNTEEVLGKRLQEIVHAVQLTTSKSEARRVIEQGGITLNDQRINDPAYVIKATDFLQGKFLILGKGKKNIAMLTSKAPVKAIPSIH